MSILTIFANKKKKKIGIFIVRDTGSSKEKQNWQNTLISIFWGETLFLWYFPFQSIQILLLSGH